MHIFNYSFEVLTGKHIQQYDCAVVRMERIGQYWCQEAQLAHPVWDTSVPMCLVHLHHENN